MAIDWSTVFDRFGSKMVTANDVGKSAYVPTEEQRAAFEAAGKDPDDRAIFDIDVLFDPLTRSIEISYYNSVRAGSGRPPETRIGRDLIRWAGVGDQIIIGNKGASIMVARVPGDKLPAADVGAELARKGDLNSLLQKAKAAGKPAKKLREVTDFVRNPYVIAVALIRAKDACEMPACARGLFKRDNGRNFLEVHHIVPLSEGGDDTLANVAALCPTCHREMHHGVHRSARTKTLKTAIAAKPLP